MLMLAAAMLAAPPAATPAPSRTQLATAITAMTSKKVAANNLRTIACKPIAEEPTEFSCRWQQRVSARARWRGYSAMMAKDGSGWTLIDVPGVAR